jgi:hypothetical protein
MIFASLYLDKEEIKFAFAFSLSSSFAAGSRSYNWGRKTIKKKPLSSIPEERGFPIL